jgi:4-amino-4-deoxy-L-arabinose transferase-like glycosyltransferase
VTLVDTSVPPCERPVVLAGEPGRPPRRPALVLRRVWRGRPSDPAWVRPLLLVLLGATAFTYLIDLSASGWANDFYSGAVQSATRSWKALFFGSTDPANAITVDKSPAALWVMDLSARIFGLSSWSILAPQALEGVACVSLLYLTVRRTASAAAGLLAGTLLALTPAAALMFRFNNPDALLVLALTASAYAGIRAIQSGRTGWLLMAGVLVGVGFEAKMLQALLVVPAIALAYLIGGPVRLARRAAQLLVSGVAMFISATWWIAAVMLVPPADRPFIGGTQDNNVLSLVLGYNGLGRLSGSETGSVGFTGPTSGGGGGANLFRLFNHEFGGYIAWLLPTALLALAVGVVILRRQPRTDAQRAAFVLWGGWLIVTGTIFSLGRGIIHPYYSIALAPPIAALVAMGCSSLWAQRSEHRARVVLAAMVAVTIGCADLLVSEASAGGAGRQVAVVLVILMLAGAILAGPRLRPRARRLTTALTVLVCLGGPLLGTITAATTPQHTAGPSIGGPARTGAASGQGVEWSNWLLEGASTSTALTSLLRQDAGRFTWAAAAAGSERATSYQLASGEPVMAVGGFNGTDPAPTLSQFKADVAHGRIHWFVGGAPSQWLGGADASAIASWVQANFPEVTIDGTRIYDLASLAGSRQGGQQP